jgi:hypothetical protein
MKRKILILLVSLFLFSSFPIEIIANNGVSTNLIEGLQKKPRKKYKKRTDHAPKTVHVKGYRKKNGTYVHSYNRRSPKRK